MASKVLHYLVATFLRTGPHRAVLRHTHEIDKMLFCRIKTSSPVTFYRLPIPRPGLGTSATYGQSKVRLGFKNDVNIKYL